MRRALIAALLAVVVSLLPAGPAPATEAPAVLLELGAHDTVFSPDGDGQHDSARVWFGLAKRSAVSVKVRSFDGELLRTVRLGVLSGGRHVWSWNGRADGQVLADGRYHLEVRAWSGTRTGRAYATTMIRTAGDPGRLLLSRSTVHPAATVVRDRLAIAYVRDGYIEEVAQYPEYFGPQLRLRTRLVIRAPDGERVRVATRRTYRPTFIWTARDASGEPLPAGAYRLRLTVADSVGNVRTIRRKIMVSAAQLVEQRWTSTTAAALTDEGPFRVYDPGCNGCGEVCDAVPSQRYPDGLSFRQPCEFGYAALQYFGTSLPFAPAPVDSWRVTASGGPTAPGDTDVGYLDGIAMGPGDTTVSTPWRRVDLLHHPYVPEGRQPAVWSFATSQGNSYDVATFTVEYRHYVPVG